MLIKNLALAGAFALSATVMTTTAVAACSFENDVEIKTLSAGFEAWKAVTDAMAECGNVSAELDQEFRTKQPAAFAANPSLYAIGGVSNGTVTPLLNEGTIRPLDDLVAKYGENLSPNQLIRVNGEVIAIAMMVNTQHLMYRKDIFEDLGLDVPRTYDEVLVAAQTIQDAGVVDYPLGATMASGWNIAQDFNNMFLGYGGTFYNEDSTPAVNSEAGIKALEMMKKLTAYMDPEYLVSDSTYVQQQFQQGKIAMANLWGSRGGAMDDPAESQVVGKNIDDATADAAFRVAMEGLDSEMVQGANEDAIWLISGYTPGDMASGAIATATATPAPISYPSTSQMGLMHTALGNKLDGFSTGNMTAEETLAAVEEDYISQAKEAGLLE